MGKNKDLIQILILVLIGMFIPFFGSIILSFELDIANISDLIKIGSTFGYFLLIFGIEMAVIYLYFTMSSWTANKKMKKFGPKH